MVRQMGTRRLSARLRRDEESKTQTARYYDQLLAKIDAEGAALIKLERQFNALSQAADNTPKRLRAKEIVATAKLNQGKRQL